MKRLILFLIAITLIQAGHAQDSDDGIFVSMMKGIRQNKKAERERLGITKEKKQRAERYQPYRIGPAQNKDYKACLQRGGGNKCSMDEFSHRGLTMNFGLISAAPIQDYKKLSNKVNAGFTTGLEYQVAPKVPMSIGFNLNYLIAGFENYRANIPFFVYSPGSGSYLGTSFLPLKVNVKNNLFSMHGVIRWWAPTKYVQPYIIGMGGFQHAGTTIKYYTNDKILFLGINNEGLIYRDNILSSINWNAGVGVGLGINIGYSANLDIRATYMQSGNMTYYTRDNIKNWRFSYVGALEDFDTGSVSSDGITSTPPFAPLRSPIQSVWVSMGINIFFE